MIVKINFKSFWFKNKVRLNINISVSKKTGIAFAHVVLLVMIGLIVPKISFFAQRSINISNNISSLMAEK
jgi:hypothetical protein